MSDMNRSMAFKPLDKCRRLSTTTRSAQGMGVLTKRVAMSRTMLIRSPETESRDQPRCVDSLRAGCRRDYTLRPFWS